MVKRQNLLLSMAATPFGNYTKCTRSSQSDLGGNMPQQDEAILAVDVPEAARRLGLSSRTVATLVARRELPSHKVGRRRIVEVAALKEFIRRDHALLRVTSPQSKQRTAKSE